jgi:hypothetical protein
MVLHGLLPLDTNKQKENKMQIRYNWNLGQVEHKPENGFITKIDYTVSASDGWRNAEASGSTNYEPKEDGEFKLLQEVTLEDMIRWVQELVGKDSVEASLASNIEAQPNPVLTSNLPWKVSEPHSQNN